MENKLQNQEVAVRLSGVKKMYRLGQIGGGTLHGDLSSWWARIRGKEDPNSMIGTDQRLVGRTFMALNGIDLTIYKGEALGIIGGNGAGKSTMLKLLSRVTAPTEGEIDIYGRIASMLEVGTGFHGELTGRENVYMNGAILGMTKAEIDSKMEDIIEFSEVREFIDTPVKRYSSGMYVKLAFSVAAHLDSEIMIMDEVLAVGDMAFQKKCLNKMKDAAKKEGRTVLYVSHNMNTIRQLCDRCVVLDQGRVIYEGDVESSIAQYLRSTETSDTNKDYTDYFRDNWYGKDRIRVQWAKQVKQDGTEACVFERSQPYGLSMCVRSNTAVNDVGFRLEIRDLFGNPLGAASIYDMYFHEGENYITANFDLSMLAPGRYKVVYTMFTMGGTGGNAVEDWIPGLGFEIVDTNQSGTKLTWSIQALGNFILPDAEIVELR